ncbi:MAG TPA: hypothetical protein VN577_15005 [Terriglobales bacterium]|nr:hypothetical protein [Terriglobales bacterium]
MPTGFAHIISLGVVSDSAGIRVPQYQFTFNDGGKSYGRTFDETSLIQFLSQDIALRPDLLDQALADLRDHRNATIRNLTISENDAAFMGFKEVPSDF